MTDFALLEHRIAAQWDAEIVPELTEYIRVPAKSPHFDAEWAAHGHIERVVRAAERWRGLRFASWPSGSPRVTT